MIKYKKLGLGLSILFGLVTFFSLGTPKTLAYVQARSDIAQCLSSLKFTDIAHIECSAGSSGKISFIDNNPTDGNANYAPVDASLFCTVSTRTNTVGLRGGSIQTPAYSISPDVGFGINLNGVSSTLNDYVLKNKLSSVASTAYLTYASGTDCIPYGNPASPSPGGTVKLPTANVGSAGQTNKLLTWSGENIVSLSGVSHGSLSGITYTRIPGEDPGGDSNHVLFGTNNFSATDCKGSVLDTTTDGTTAKLFDISLANGAGSVNADLKRLLTGNGCDSTAVNLANVASFDLAGPIPTLKVDTTGTAGQPGGQNGTPASSAPSACEQNSSGSAFTWLLCPVLDAASKLTGALVNLFTGQLTFRVESLGSTADPNSGAASVQLTWTIIKDLASALLVIIGLLMVIGQAIERGPFDAYTVKKILPRLVVAAIVIQLSWSVVGWVVNLFDDIGRGLTGIMYLAFGGSDNMQLFALLGKAHLGTFTLATFDWAGVVGLTILGVAFPFMMLGMATVAILGLLAALLTLVFRKILIITALIFAPIAILAWVLPGTQKFWKLWQDNFIKALAMFPIAVAIIAAGRIFAYITATQDNSTLISLLFILVGFFGPLFILPKTFKWGGTVMSMAGNGIMKAGNKMSERPKKFFDTRQEGYSAERQRRSQERYSRQEGLNWKAPWRRPIDLVRSGQIDPTLWGRRKQQAMDTYVQKGVESEEVDMKAADARLGVLLDQVAPDKHDELAQAFATGNANYRYKTVDGVEHKLGKVSTPQRRAGWNAVMRLGGKENLRVLQDEQERAMALDNSGNFVDSERATSMKRFMSANAQSLLPKMTHMYKGLNGTVEGMKAGDITSMDGQEMETLLGGLTEEIRIQSDPVTGDAGKRARAVKNLSTLVSTFHEAATSESTRAHISPAVAIAMKSFVDGTNIDQVNAGRGTVGAPLIAQPQPNLPPATQAANVAQFRTFVQTDPNALAANPQIGQQLAQLAQKIDPNGAVRP